MQSIPSLLGLISLEYTAAPSPHTSRCLYLQAHALVAVADCEITSPTTGDRVAEGIVVQVGIAFDNFLVMHHAFGRRLVQLLCIEEAKLQTRKCSTDRLGQARLQLQAT